MGNLIYSPSSLDYHMAFQALELENGNLRQELAILQQRLANNGSSSPCPTVAGHGLTSQERPRPATSEPEQHNVIPPQSEETSWLDLAIEGAQLGAWEWKPHTNALAFDQRWAAMLGYDEHELETSEEVWRRLMHPDDLLETRAKFAEHLAGASPMFSMEHRMAHKHGHWVWVLNRGRVVERDAQGAPVRVCGVQLEVGARRVTEGEVREAVASCQRANRAKSAFLANMSHEIRTPLAGILGAGTLLLETPLAPDQRELAGMMVESTQQLLAIVNDILDLSKVEEGCLKVEAVPTDLDEILAHVQELFRTQARDKGIGLQVRRHADGRAHRWILADPTRLRQILLNLVGNAVKFTHQGHVTISAELTPCAGLPTCEAEQCECQQNHDGGNNGCCPIQCEQAALCAGGCQAVWDLRVDVVDTGIGMSADAVAHVFDRFHQAEDCTARIYGGSGLGTTISKELATRMGGDITVASEPGRGSTFTLRLPVRRVQAVPPITQAAVPMASSTTGETARPGAAAGMAPRSYGLTAILAEDNSVNRCIVEKLLRALGFQVIPACNGQEVLDLVRNGVYHHLIFMDIQMPVCDGVTATKALRAQGYGRPIVALTANVMAADLQAYLAAGMNGTVPKPYSRAQICEEIDRLVSIDALARITDNVAVACVPVAAAPTRLHTTAACYFLGRPASFYGQPEHARHPKRRHTRDVSGA